MLPFTPQQQFVETSATVFDKKNFYQQRIHEDVFEVLDLAVGRKFREQNAWELEALVAAVQAMRFIPNPSKIKEQDIIFAILNHENVRTVGAYVVKTTQPLNLDWFLSKKKTN